MSAARRQRRQAVNTADLGRCLLCGKRPVWRGVWAPSDRQRAALGIDQTQHVVYSLCPRCERRPGKLSKVEAKIMAAAHAEFGDPGCN